MNLSRLADIVVESEVEVVQGGLVSRAQVGQAHYAQWLGL